jgi:pyridoxamine 5'-phosphate oxidase
VGAIGVPPELIWTTLSEACAAPGHPLRTPTLATIDASIPSLRMVVLRAVRPEARALVFHTDTRSAKWAQLAANPAASVLTWDPESQIQMRLTGQITRHGPDSPEAQSAWNVLPPYTRNTYAGAPPGGALEATSGTDTDAFGVLVFTAQTLDWLHLSRAGNRRAQVDLNTGHATWVAP